MSRLSARKLQAASLSTPCRPSSASLQSKTTSWRICQATSLKQALSVPITTLGAFFSDSVRHCQLSASVTFLFGVGKLENEFSIQKKACAKCVGTQLELTPLVPDPRFKKIFLEVDEKSAVVLKSTVIDPDGSENAIAFSNLKTNAGVSKDVFVLNAPAGTQVQDLTAPK